MSRTESSMVGLGTTAPDFQLVNVMTGNTMNLDEVRGPGKKPGLLIMFVCAHCPYVKHVEVELARIGVDYFGQSGEGPIAIAAIQSNDVFQTFGTACFHNMGFLISKASKYKDDVPKASDYKDEVPKVSEYKGQVPKASNHKDEVPKAADNGKYIPKVSDQKA